MGGEKNQGGKILHELRSVKGRLFPTRGNHVRSLIR